MINSELHKQAIPVDTVKHRGLRLRRRYSTLYASAGLNACMITISEFSEACKEFPIFFLPAGNSAEGKPQVVPVAVFGLRRGENLFLPGVAAGTLPPEDTTLGIDWIGRYIPGMLRAYPFTMGRIDNERYALCMDSAWPGLTESADVEARELFDAQGQMTPFMKELQMLAEQLEVDGERTRMAGERLVELGLLQSKRFDATLADGEKISVDGFLAIDDAKLKALPDETLLELQRQGLLAALTAHQISLGNMRFLVDLRKRHEQAAAVANGAAQ